MYKFDIFIIKRCINILLLTHKQEFFLKVYMKIALVFPGQGSQFIGMGRDFADKYDVSKQVFTDLDAILGRNLSKIIFYGPIEDLTLTINSQPSIMAVSVAILNTIKKNNLLNLNKVSAVA